MIKECLPDERIDDLMCNGYYIIQKPEGFCFGMDAVLLANFTKVKKGQKVIDLGTGTGVIPLLLDAKHEDILCTGLEIQEEYADMASRSVRMNDAQSRIDILRGDIKEAASILSAASFDVVTTNPPYMDCNHGLHNPYEAKNIARHEILCNLEDVVKAAAYAVRPGGSVNMVHKPFRLVEIMKLMVAYKLEPKRMCFVHPYIDKEPNMVLIEAVRGGKSRITIEPPIIVYKEPNVYTDQIYNIYGTV